ncbi:MAG: hypothetical protein NC177_00215 [Ruminococcus flavefaciens]|nr:hypothetical protein [Ruminococcus flavefaciens]
MKEIEVNHTPDFMKWVAIAMFILWIISTVIICYNTSEAIALLLSLGILIAIIGIAFYIDCTKTVIEYDEEKIRWKWIWITYKVNFKEMESVHYTITSERTRYGGYIRRFEIVFKVNDDELRLNDNLKIEDIENSINGTPDDIKLMELYKFIESVCPEKSKGFIKTDPEIF